MTEPVSAEGYGDVLSGRLMKLRNKQPMRHSLVRLLNEGGSRLKDGQGGLVVPGFGDYVAQGIAEVSRIVELSPQDYWRPKFVRLGIQYRESKAHSVLFMEGKVLDLAGAWVAPGDPLAVARAMGSHQHMLTLYVPFDVYKYPLTFAFTSATEMRKWSDRISEACRDELTAREGGLGRFRVLLVSVHGASQFSLEVGHAGYSVRSAAADSCPIEVKDVPVIHSNPNSCIKISVWLEQPGERGPPVKGLEVHCPLYEVAKQRSQIISYEPPLDTKEATAAVGSRIGRIEFVVEVTGGSFPVWSRYLMPIRGPECGWPQELTLNNFTDASLGPCFRRIGQDFSLARGFADKIQAVSYFERPVVSAVWLVGLSIWVIQLYEYTLFFLFSLGILSLLKRHPLALAVRNRLSGWTRRLGHCKWEKVGDAMESGERMDVYESERRLFLFADFSAEHLLLWDPPQWSTLVGSSGGVETVPCKGPRTVMSDGSCWSWQVIVDASTDENGYQYSMTFGDGNWLKECDAWCYVRRRLFRGAKVRPAPVAKALGSQSESGLRQRVLSVQLLPRASSTLSVEGESPSLSPTPVMAMPRSTVPTPWEVMFNKLKQHIEDTLLAILSACVVLEKTKNLFTWKCPWASSVSLCILLLLAALSALIPTRFLIESIIICYFISGFTIGVKRRSRRREFIDRVKEAAKSKRQLRSFVSHLVIDSWGPGTRLEDLGCPLLSLCGWVNRKYNVTIDLRTMQQIGTLLEL
ncbi:hypothetical protein FOL47_009411, partial [Perkinsus chesapeaki]